MKLVLSLGQMRVEVGQPEANLEQVRAWAAEAAARGSGLILFPELWPMGYDLSHWQRYAAPLGEGLFAQVSDLARDSRIAIGGSMLELRESRVFNTFALFDARGETRAVYRKVHLFQLMGEQRWLTPGDCVVVAGLDWGKTGLAICYDLRFPELFRRCALEGASLLLVPAAWPKARVAHWQTLLRARAIENQYFVAGCNCVGAAKRETFGGRSAVVDPGGALLVEAGEEQELVTAELDLDELVRIRTALPVLADRRPDLY